MPIERYTNMSKQFMQYRFLFKIMQLGYYFEDL